MKKSLIVLAVFNILFLLSLVSANIYFTELEDIYNLGDTITLQVTTDPVVEERLLKTSLFCNEVQVIEFNQLPDESGKSTIQLPLNTPTIQQIEGKCYFVSVYTTESKKTNEFIISRKLLIVLDTEKFFANPNEEIIISGTASRMNGQPVNGDIQINIPLLKKQNMPLNSNDTIANNSNSSNTQISDTVYYGTVENGVFSVPILVADNTPANHYRMDILVAEYSAGEKASTAIALADIEVFQILQTVELAVNKINFDPGETLEAKPLALDQSGVFMNQDISISIYNAEEEKIFEKIISSDETTSFLFPTNLTAGYYTLEARTADKSRIKKIYVNEKDAIALSLQNQSLMITNIGNIPYNKDVQVFLNGKPFIKHIELVVGESTHFRLSGENEKYDVKITDGEIELAQSEVFLTGFAAGIDVPSSSFMPNNPILWIFLSVVLVLIILFLIRNKFKKKSYAYYTDQAPQKSFVPFTKPSKREQLISDYTSIPAAKAEQGLIQAGNREKAVVVALKIKNKINAEAEKFLENMMEHAYQKKGACYKQEEFIYTIFASVMTKAVNNEMRAVHTAEKFSTELKEYNRKFKEKIEWGIGINTGEIIAFATANKLQFTALGSCMIAAKKLAQFADKKIMLTKDAYQNVSHDIKADKIAGEGVEYYEIRQIVDLEKNKKFIDDFLKREGKIR